MNNKAKSDGRSQTLGMVQVALFAALIIIMACTGYYRFYFTWSKERRCFRRHFWTDEFY